MMPIRCSQLPILAHCQGMLHGNYIAVNPQNEAANEGTIIHAEIAAALTEGRWTSDNKVASRILHALQQDIIGTPELLIERKMKTKIGDIELIGHPDLFYLTPTSFHLIDYKTGWKADDSDDDGISIKHSPQLMGYAAILMNEYLYHRANVFDITVFTRKSIYRETWTREIVQDWQNRFLDSIIYWDGIFRPGEHCTYCPRRFDCPALLQVQKSAIQAIADTDILANIMTAQPQQVIILKERATIVRKCADAVDDAIRKRLENEPDGLTDGEKRIYLAPVSRTTIDPQNGWWVLADELTPAELAGVVNIVKSKLENAIKDKSPRGNKAEEVNRVMRRLNDADAIRIEASTPRITIKKESSE